MALDARLFDTAMARLAHVVLKPVARGRLRRVAGMLLEAEGCDVSLGDVCQIAGDNGNVTEAEVVGFEDGRIFMMAVAEVGRLRPGAEVIPVAERQVGVGGGFLGRVVDGNGNPLDAKGPVEQTFVSLYQPPINPLMRKPVSEVLDVGIGTINSLLTVGRGQRLGLFAGSGVGKSVLLGMMTRYTEADVIVVGLVGERGREVKEFIDETLGAEGLRRAVVVASPADDSPTLKMRAAVLATRMAEHFRDSGKHVLLLIDSLTRYAQAQRQVALAIGEPPSTKGYPPSVFAMIPQLVERAGNSGGESGSLTAFYTVLTEGDDQQDPVADSARAILDGHVVLSRRLAEAGVFPAIDVEASISRIMPAITTGDHGRAARQFRKIYGLYRRNEDLITVGAYTAGHDAALDDAVTRYPKMLQFLEQDMNEQLDFQTSLGNLGAVVGPVETSER